MENKLTLEKLKELKPSYLNLVKIMNSKTRYVVYAEDIGDSCVFCIGTITRLEIPLERMNDYEIVPKPKKKRKVFYRYVSDLGLEHLKSCQTVLVKKIKTSVFKHGVKITVMDEKE